MSAAKIKNLITDLRRADVAPQRAQEAEAELKILAEAASIKLLLPMLTRDYPPSQATDSAIRVLQALKANEQGNRYLIAKLKDPRPKVRIAAATALESFPNPRSAKAVVKATMDSNVDVSIGAIHAIYIWSLNFPALKKVVFDVCKHAIQHQSHGVRGAGYENLSHMADARARKLLDRSATDSHLQIRQFSASWIRSAKAKKGER